MPKIQIDATKLYYQSFQIHTVPNSWKSTQVVQTIDLPAGQYQFQVASGALAFLFTVNADATISYDPKLSTFLAGQGTNKLIVNGVEVTIDARYLLGQGILVDANAMNPVEPLAAKPPGFHTYGKVRLLPCPRIAVIQGSALVSSFTYGIDINGKFTYAPEFDIAKGGFLSGQGTSTLVFYGYPVLIDFCAANRPVSLAGVPYKASDALEGTLMGNLLPIKDYCLLIQSKTLERAVFGVDPKGQLMLDPTFQKFFTIDTFKGIPRLKATAALQ